MNLYSLVRKTNSFNLLKEYFVAIMTKDTKLILSYLIFDYLKIICSFFLYNALPSMQVGTRYYGFNVNFKN